MEKRCFAAGLGILVGGFGGPTFLFHFGLRNDRDNKFYCGLVRDRQENYPTHRKISVSGSASRLFANDVL